MEKQTMAKGATGVHAAMRKALGDYLKAQYLGKSAVLRRQTEKKLDSEGILFQQPYIEASAAYKSEQNGLIKANLPAWLKDFFEKLSKAHLGVYASPFVHQIKALEESVKGRDLFVATGTGSGKTECFLWPMLAKLATEAKDRKESWKQRSVRVIMLYPMNALVADQISRLRRLIGDTEQSFIKVFRDCCGNAVRRPQFGMYTGRTPFPGNMADGTRSKTLAKNLTNLLPEKDGQPQPYYEALLSEGKIPAKVDLAKFIKDLKEAEPQHSPDPDDAELITRFEMQQNCPDILITNYSMLEYMLVRNQENDIWEETKEWLAQDEDNKLLFVIDEAHVYKGASGGEVALLIRRLFHRLGINRSQAQFIMTTASMPYDGDEDERYVKRFFYNLTAAENGHDFCYLQGEKEDLSGEGKYDIPCAQFLEMSLTNLENGNGLTDLNEFWQRVQGGSCFSSMDEAGIWMYDHLLDYKPFHKLIKSCRGTAIPLKTLAEIIFPDAEEEDALTGIGVLLAIAPLARNRRGTVLFPVRMHMLFRGLQGLYACTNPDCHSRQTEDGLSLGEVVLSDNELTCPTCGGMVYELHNERRCGALFYHGYVLDSEYKNNNDRVYLWHFPGQMGGENLREIQLYIPPEGYEWEGKSKDNPVKPCYLDSHSGFINFRDDSLSGRPGVRKLYYSESAKEKENKNFIFASCPHCLIPLSGKGLLPFTTRGNNAFANLMKAQFDAQPPVAGKENRADLPNAGRKVLLFSDSRQRAARLAKDMSDSADITAIRQLFLLAVEKMRGAEDNYSTLEYFYAYLCLVAGERNLQLFTNDERVQFKKDCREELVHYEKRKARNKSYNPKNKMSACPDIVKEYMIKLYCGRYNNLYSSASSWVELSEEALDDVLESLDDSGISAAEDEVQEVFNAWYMSKSNRGILGHLISDDIRKNVLMGAPGGKYGLDSKDCEFSDIICKIMDWPVRGGKNARKSQEKQAWLEALSEILSRDGSNGYYIDLSKVKPRISWEGGKHHTWYRCLRCSNLTPFALKNHCPVCGKEELKEMTDRDYRVLDFWRKPLEDALINRGEIELLRTEEHTAQLSHKDGLDLWSKTEEYELLFRDVVPEDEVPVDFLSCTTTMEVGIDIGSLVAVGLRNMPPLRENYQQRAGRAGRRGASLSTIATYCEDGAHDAKYFDSPAEMLCGRPRRPWIDINSDRLLRRHVSIVAIEEFFKKYHTEYDMDRISVKEFFENCWGEMKEFLSTYKLIKMDILLPRDLDATWQQSWRKDIRSSLENLKKNFDEHPELFGIVENNDDAKPTSLLDALWNEGVIPTFSFPKNVVSLYVTEKGTYKGPQVVYAPDRDLSIAISEYAPGRAVVINKDIYAIGGFYVPGSEKRKLEDPAHRAWRSAARAYMKDRDYLKEVVKCNSCGWFDVYTARNEIKECPFCGNGALEFSGDADSQGRPLLKPWGFAPKNATKAERGRLVEEYSSVTAPLYSTVPVEDDMEKVAGYSRIRMAVREGQKIIMLNKGPAQKGFLVCEDCGAAVPGDNDGFPYDMNAPYSTVKGQVSCKHYYTKKVDLGCDFITDMTVLEFELDKAKLDLNKSSNSWLSRAGQSLAEAFALAVTRYLDIDYAELVPGYRVRTGDRGIFIDVYLYDSLSSGAGYSVSLRDSIAEVLQKTEELLDGCNCELACYSCLKHYRNRFSHGSLDRKAALQLLKWGKNSEVASDIPLFEQKNGLLSLERILNLSDYSLKDDADGIRIEKGGVVKEIIVYPDMCKKRTSKNKIYVSDFAVRYAKPFAISTIIEGMTEDNNPKAYDDNKGESERLVKTPAPPRVVNFSAGYMKLFAAAKKVGKNLRETLEQEDLLDNSLSYFEKHKTELGELELYFVWPDRKVILLKDNDSASDSEKARKLVDYGWAVFDLNKELCENEFCMALRR